MQKKPNSEADRAGKKTWEAPKLAYVGDVEELVQGGQGKLSAVATDPGEMKKTRPSG